EVMVDRDIPRAGLDERGTEIAGTGADVEDHSSVQFGIFGQLPDRVGRQNRVKPVRVALFGQKCPKKPNGTIQGRATTTRPGEQHSGKITHLPRDFASFFTIAGRTTKAAWPPSLRAA